MMLFFLLMIFLEEELKFMEETDDIVQTSIQATIFKNWKKNTVTGFYYILQRLVTLASITINQFVHLMCTAADVLA